MASGEAITSQPGKMQSVSDLPTECVLGIATERQPDIDKWDKENFKKRYCEIKLGYRPSLKVYDSDKKAGTSHTLRLDAALKADKWCRGQVVTEDGRVLCVMEDDEQRVSGWVDSLNSVIKRATSNTDGKMKTDGEGVQHTADSTTLTAGTRDGEDSETCEGEEYRTTPHVPRQLSERPKVIKEGWLNIHTDPAPGEDKWDKVQTRYCVLQRQGDSYRLKVYEEEDYWWRYEEDSDTDRDTYSDSRTCWTGNVATVCLDTARHAQLCSTLCEVVTMDDKVLCVMRETDDVMSRWVVSLNRAIMAARCQDTSQTATDSSDQADTEDRQGGVPPSESQVGAVSHAEIRGD